jgi:hypothetical protein
MVERPADTFGVLSAVVTAVGETSQGKFGKFGGIISGERLLTEVAVVGLPNFRR